MSENKIKQTNYYKTIIDFLTADRLSTIEEIHEHKELLKKFNGLNRIFQSKKRKTRIMQIFALENEVRRVNDQIEEYVDELQKCREAGNCI